MPNSQGGSSRCEPCGGLRRAASCSPQHPSPQQLRSQEEYGGTGSCKNGNRDMPRRRERLHAGPKITRLLSPGFSGFSFSLSRKPRFWHNEQANATAQTRRMLFTIATHFSAAGRQDPDIREAGRGCSPVGAERSNQSNHCGTEKDAAPSPVRQQMTHCVTTSVKGYFFSLFFFPPSIFSREREMNFSRGHQGFCLGALPPRSPKATEKVIT